MDLLILKCNKAANEPLALIIHSFYSAVTRFCILERRARETQMHCGNVCVILILLAGPMHLCGAVSYIRLLFSPSL